MSNDALRSALAEQNMAFPSELPSLDKIQDDIFRAMNFLDACFSPAGFDMRFVSLKCSEPIGMKVGRDGDKMVLTFTDPRPKVTLLHILTREVESLAVTTETITFSIQGFPSLSIRVES
jgi:hypothetical protein